MITRLMLSLKKAASKENGWSFTEMTTARRADEMGATHVRHGDRTQPSLDGYRAREGYGVRSANDYDLEEFSVDIPEEIGIAITTNLEEPR